MKYSLGHLSVQLILGSSKSGLFSGSHMKFLQSCSEDALVGENS